MCLLGGGQGREKGGNNIKTFKRKLLDFTRFLLELSIRRENVDHKVVPFLSDFD